MIKFVVRHLLVYTHNNVYKIGLGFNIDPEVTIKFKVQGHKGLK